MKPVSIIFLIAAVVMVIVGLLMCSFSMMNAQKQGVDIYDTKIENGSSESEYDFSEDILGKIQIKVGKCDVKIVCGSEENLVVVKNFSPIGYVCEVQNRALVVEDTVNLFDLNDIAQGNWRFKGFRNLLRARQLTATDKSVTVYISDKYDIKVIDVSVESGKVEITGYENSTDYKIYVKNGSVEASDINTNSSVDVEIEKGDVTLNHVYAKMINVKGTESNISAVTKGDEITVLTEKGNINIESETSLSEYNYALKAPNSTITLEEVVKTGIYTANDAQLTGFIHATSEEGSVTVKSYKAKTN